MMASNNPSRRARGWEELSPVCGAGALNAFGPNAESQAGKSSYDTLSNAKASQ
jgi:hypothetical protein